MASARVARLAASASPITGRLLPQPASAPCPAVLAKRHTTHPPPHPRSTRTDLARTFGAGWLRSSPTGWPRRLHAVAIGRRICLGRLLQAACFASRTPAASSDEPQWKMYTVSGAGNKSRCEVQTSDGFQVVTDTPKAMGGTNQAAQPVYLLLSALCGCETATAQFVARQMRIRIRDIQFEVSAWRDQRGALKLPLEDIDGYDIPSHLQVVDGTAIVDTDASQDQIDQLAHQVHRRCPVASMMTASGCRVNIKWEVKK